MVVLVLVLLVGLATAGPLSKEKCEELYWKQGISSNYNETVAHAVHSMTVQGLRMFNPRATADNKVPTVNRNHNAEEKVIPYAPDAPVGDDYVTDTMNTIDDILSHIGNEHDGLGPNWSPIERVVHNFHMSDLWQRILPVYQEVRVTPPGGDVCDCIMETSSNGIFKAVEWIAHHYESGTPITLLNRPIPKLTDASAWAIWKARLLYYYKQPALYDAAVFLYCATKDF